MNIPSINVANVATGQAVEVAPGQAVEVANVATGRAVEVEVDGINEVVKEPRTKTEKWKVVESYLTNDFINTNKELSELLVKLFKPASGGGGHLKDMTRRIENVKGELVAKKCDVLGLWFLEKAFSKNKYMTKVAYAALMRKKKDIDAMCRTLLMSGQGLNETQRLIYDPASDKGEVEKALIGLLGDEVQSMVENLNTLGLYCGATKEEAEAYLPTIGKL